MDDGRLSALADAARRLAGARTVEDIADAVWPAFQVCSGAAGMLLAPAAGPSASRGVGDGARVLALPDDAGSVALAGAARGGAGEELAVGLCALGLAVLRSADAALALQRALLPQSLPELPGLELCAHYAPAVSGARGDWYDAFALPGGRLGLAVGDTTGRGVAATAAMGQARAALRGFALEGHGPAEVLRRLDLVISAFDERALTTCVFAVYDPASRRLTAASAGHLPPLLVDAAGQGGYLDVEVGLPLGAGGMRLGTYADLVLTVHPGSTLVLFTDGLLRRSGSGPDGGLEAIRRLVAGSVQDALAGMLASLVGRAPDAVDDVAVVALRASPSAGAPGEERSLEVELPASLQAARIARARVLAALTEWGHGGSDDAGRASGSGGFEAVDAAVLLTDELVTNAVVHAQSPLRLQLELRADRLRVAVTDESPRLPSPRRQDPVDEGLDAVAEGGRGLRLVELIASRWGVDPLPVGKRIWFEVELPGAGS